MKDYTYIESIEPQEGGISNVILRGNKRLIVEITELGDKFRAEIYHIYSGDPKDAPPKKRKSFLKKVENNDANEVLENALGWIDENQGDIPDETEIRLSKLK